MLDMLPFRRVRPDVSTHGLLRIDSLLAFVGACMMMLALALPANAAPGEGDWPFSVRTALGADGSGVARFRPGSWLHVAARVENHTDQGRTVSVGLRLVDQPSVWFTRSVYVPASSVRTVNVPIYGESGPEPAPNVRGLRTVACEARVFDSDASRDQPLSLPYAGQLIVSNSPSSTLLLDGADEHAVDAVSRARENQGYRPAPSPLEPQRMPLSRAGLDTIDTIVVAGPLPTLSDAQIDAIRQWLVSGGRLWIMLADADDQLIPALLGDADFTVLDRVTTMQMVLARGEDAAAVTFDQPADVVHVFADDWDVLHEADGWPAALTRTVGKGLVLVSTIDPRALAIHDGAAWVLEDPARLMFAPPTRDDLVITEALAPAAASRIGYSVIGRTTIAFVLGALCVVMAVGGVSLRLMQKPALVALLLSGSALLAAVILLAIGLSRRGGAPATIAEVALVRQGGDVQAQHADAVAAVYLPTAGDGQLEVDGLLWPGAGDGQALRRVQWADLNQARWARTAPAPGQVGLFNASAATTAAPVTSRPVRVQLGGESAAIDLGAQTDLQDLLLVCQSGFVSLPVGREGDAANLASLSPFAQPLPPGQYSTTGQLSSEQRRRQIILRQWLGGDQPDDSRRLLLPELLKPWNMVHAPPQISLLGWRVDEQTTISVDDANLRRSEQAVLMPLQIERPQPGATVAAPWPLIGVDVGYGRTWLDPSLRQGLGVAQIYNPRNNTWDSTEQPGVVTLGFILPPPLQPMTVERLRLSMSLTAPGRQVDVIAFARDGAEIVWTGQGPDGVVDIDIPGGPLLQPDAQGRIPLAVRVGPGPGARSGAWSLQRPRLSIWGVVGPPVLGE